MFGDGTVRLVPTHGHTEMTRSLSTLRQLRDRQEATVLYGHDPGQWEAIPRAPKSLIGA